MPKKRSRLVVSRAVARVRKDAWDDLWPDVLSLLALPNNPSEYLAARRRIEAFRRGGRIPVARIGLVPKPNGLMRPARNLQLDSRLYYQALVDSFMYDIDKHLVGKNFVFGNRPLAPRTTSAPFGYGLRQWKRFRAQVRSEVDTGKYGAMVRTDLVGFFDRIPHGPLEERLTSLGVRDDVAKELRSFLKATMGKAHGLPQGPDPSGVLANAYLHPLDQAVIAAGFGYVRYVDDFVVLAKDQTQAKLALRLLESEARLLDLTIQSAKTELVIGMPAMVEAVSDDDEIAAIDYVVRTHGRPAAVTATRKAWRAASRRSTSSRRLLKYLLGRLTDNRDPVAVAWCLKGLGDLDYLAPTVARYLSLFAGRPSVQLAVTRHLSSPKNISEWEEMNLLRSMLSARRVTRPLLDRSRKVAADRNVALEVRQFAFALLGRHGDGGDHDFVARECLDSEMLAAAGLLALHGAAAKTRGRLYADVATRYTTLRPLAAKLRGMTKVKWPLFSV